MSTDALRAAIDDLTDAMALQKRAGTPLARIANRHAVVFGANHHGETWATCTSCNDEFGQARKAPCPDLIDAAALVGVDLTPFVTQEDE